MEKKIRPACFNCKNFEETKISDRGLWQEPVYKLDCKRGKKITLSTYLHGCDLFEGKVIKGGKR